MRYFLPLLLLVIIIAGCSKKDPPVRTNFLTLTVDGKELSFDIKDTAILDTTYPAFYWEFTAYDNRLPYSNLRWAVSTNSKWVNGVYEYTGRYNPGRSISYIYLSTYINGPFESYYLENRYLNFFAITIDKSDNGRIHATFSGTMTNSSGAVPGTIVRITNGEFEMPYMFQ